jgi:hypothetical protein
MMLEDWYALKEDDKIRITTEFLRMTDFSNLTQYLSSLINVILYVEKVEGVQAPYDWKINVAYEGVLDLFIDPSAGHAEAGKYVYDGRLSDGNIPCILEPINYCSKLIGNKPHTSYLKIPTVSWLLRDQQRMLFNAIRGVDTSHRGWGTTTYTVVQSGIDPNKYYSKVAGLLESQMNAIGALLNNTNHIRDFIVAKFSQYDCNNVMLCGPDAFISSTIQIINEQYWKRLSVACPPNIGFGIKKRKLTRKRRKP